MRLHLYLKESKKSDWDIQKDFLYWAKKIWSNFSESYALKKTNLIFTEDPNHKVLMSVIYDPRGVRVIGDVILGLASKYEIKYHTRLKSEDIDIYEKTIKHEVLHLGLSRHDSEFRRYAKKWGTASSEIGIRGDGKIRLEYLIKPRKYVILDEPVFDDPDVAATYARLILKSSIETEIFKQKHKIEGKLKFRLKY